MKPTLIPVAEARQRIVSAMRPVASETISLSEALGRVLAEDVNARVTQPPADVSAMDGYAVRAADVAEVPATLRRIGEAPAGGAFDGEVDPGQTVRIFTGGPVPRGADAIVMQEDTENSDDGDTVTMNFAAPSGHHIRPAGLDFRAGEVGLEAGRVLSARDLGLAAAMNVPWLRVRRRPRVAILATGNELVMPGEPLAANQIVSSNNVALAAFVRAQGGIPNDLGIARDDADSLRALAAAAAGSDLLLTIGGASVGDHDLVQSVLGDQGLEVNFWRIAMRPGKPLIFGQIGEIPLIGLPGNPVSALVCGLVFVKPALAALQGFTDSGQATSSALLASDLPENDQRQDYLRARLERNADGEWLAQPFGKQDSSMLSRLAKADCLVIRPPFAPAAAAGSRVDIIAFGALDDVSARGF
jgi:molybdopterin molybdotransferase